MELSKPCHLIEETDAFVVYEFRTGFLYLLYGILLTIGVGYFFNQQNPIRCGYIQIPREFGDATGYATASMQRVQSSGWFLYWPTDFSQRQQRLHLVPSALVTE